jgi:hypothetical protein
MREAVELVIVIPVGPATIYRWLDDTIDSIRHYITCTYKIIIADDSQKDLSMHLRKSNPGIHAVKTSKNLGKVSGLYFNLSAAYKYAIEHFSFTVLMKMDDDALVIGGDPQVAAIKLFREKPSIGMAGRYISGQYSVDSYGNIHNNYWPRKQLIKDTCSWKLIRRPIANWHFRKLFFTAVNNGYEIGENIQGGVYFISYSCLLRLSATGLLPCQNLKNVNFGEDLLFSLLVKVVGMELGDLGSGGLPVGCAWQGLPASPEVLSSNKKVIHSIRFWNEWKEDNIRTFFKRKREISINAWY